MRIPIPRAVVNLVAQSPLISRTSATRAKRNADEQHHHHHHHDDEYRDGDDDVPLTTYVEVIAFWWRSFISAVYNRCVV
jgi:hypothetical protein